MAALRLILAGLPARAYPNRKQELMVLAQNLFGTSWNYVPDNMGLFVNDIIAFGR